MASQRLGQFYEGFASWRRSLAKAAPEAQLIIFNNAVVEVVGYVRKGLDRAVAADELADMAASIGVVDADLVQAVIAEQFARIERINGPDGGRPGAGEEEDAADAEVVPDDWSDLDSAVDLDKAAEKFDRARERRQQRRHWPRDNGREQLQTTRSRVIAESVFVESFTPLDYLLDQVLQRRYLYALTGKTGSGKTAVALYIAACVALGLLIGELEVTQGRVLYLAGENDVDVRMRWIAMRQQLDIDGPVDVYFLPGRFAIGDEFSSLFAELEAIGEFALVVVDTSAVYYQGDEANSNVQMAEHARTFRQLTALPGGPTVLVLCHPTKHADNDNLVPYGGGAFLNELDGNLTCVVNGSAVEVHRHVDKFRGPEFAPIAFELKTVTHQRLKTTADRLIPTVVARHLSDAGREAMETVAAGNAEILLAELKRAPKLSQREYARTLGWAFRSGTPDYPKVGRLLKALKKDGLVARELGSWTLTPKGEKRMLHACSTGNGAS